MEGEASRPEKCVSITHPHWPITFSQDGNISHPTRSSRTFYASTKKWSLILLHLNLGEFVTHSLLMERVETAVQPF